MQLRRALMHLLPKLPVEPPLQLLDVLWEPVLELSAQFLLELLVELQSQLHRGPQIDLV